MFFAYDLYIHCIKKFLLQYFPLYKKKSKLTLFFIKSFFLCAWKLFIIKIYED